MSVNKYELPEGTFSCVRQRNNSYCIQDYEGNARKLLIPQQFEGIPITSIGKKAFWRNRYIQHVILSDTIEQVGEWAFSDCPSLRKITIPRREITFGNHVFQKTEGLHEISFAGSNDSVNRLMATAATVLEAEYLINPLQAGADSWYRNLDARILTIIKESEDNALKNLVYCAEEDMRGKQDDCLRKQAHKKAEIAFLRLAYPDRITDDMFETLADHLRRRTIGCAEKTAWEVVRENAQSQKAYCDILIKIGGIREDNFQVALNDLGEDAVELKAYLLKKRQNGQQTANLWESLEL